MVCCGQDVVEALNWQPADPVEPVRETGEAIADQIRRFAGRTVLQLIGTDVPVSSEELSLRGRDCAAGVVAAAVGTRIFRIDPLVAG